MRNRLSGIVRNPNYQRVAGNTVSMGLLSATNILLPLLTIPYLIKVLGIETFGLLAFATAIIAYFMVLTDYGFNYSATKEASLNLHDPAKINEIFTAVSLLKLILIAVSFVILTIITFSFEKLTSHYLLYILTFTTVIGHALFPIWYFQAIENMKLIAYLNLISKIAVTVAIFIVIQNENDYLWVPVLTALGSTLTAIMALYLIFFRFKIRFIAVNKSTLIRYMTEGWTIFYAHLFSNLISTNNIVLLGLLTNNMMVGYYAIADKIFSAFHSISSPVLSAVYPFMVKTHQKSSENFYRLFNYLNIGIFFLSLIMIALLALYIDPILIYVAHEINDTTKTVLIILTAALVQANLNPTLVQGLVILNRNHDIIRAFKYTFLLNICLATPLIIYEQAIGLAIAWWLTILGQSLFLYQAFYRAKHD
jgi:PST family polysaccharide transporter